MRGGRERKGVGRFHGNRFNYLRFSEMLWVALPAALTFFWRFFGISAILAVMRFFMDSLRSVERVGFQSRHSLYRNVILRDIICDSWHRAITWDFNSGLYHPQACPAAIWDSLISFDIFWYLLISFDILWYSLIFFDILCDSFSLGERESPERCGGDSGGGEVEINRSTNRIRKGLVWSVIYY